MPTGKGYELKASINLTDNFSKKMEGPIKALQQFDTQLKSTQKAIQGFQDANSSLFGGRAKNVLSKGVSAQNAMANAVSRTSRSAKEGATHFEKMNKGVYTFAQRQKNLHKSQLKMKETEAKLNKKLENDKVMESVKSQNKLAQISHSTTEGIRSYKQKSDISYGKWVKQNEKNLSSFREKESIKLQNKRKFREESWDRQENRRKERELRASLSRQAVMRQKAGRRAVDFVYGTNGGYGRFQYGVLPQAARGVAIGGAIGGGLALAAGTKAFTSSINKAADLEQALADIKSNTTGSDYKNWNNGVGERIKKYVKLEAVKTVYDNVETAQTYRTLLKAGRTNDQIIGKGNGRDGDLAAAMALAQATDYDPNASANLISTMMTTFQGVGMMDHGYFKKTGKVRKTKATSMGLADLIAGVSNAAVTDPQDIALGMIQAGNVSAGYGWTPDDAAALIGLMSKDGITKGQVAGSTIKVGMTTLSPTTKPAKAIMKERGLTQTLDGKGNVLFDKKGNLKSMDDVATLIYNAFKNVDNKTRMDEFHKLGGTRGMKFYQTLFEGGKSGKVDGKVTNAAGVKNFRKNITEKGVLEMQDDRTNTFQFRVGQFKNMFDNLQASFGYGFLDPFSSMINEATDQFGLTEEKVSKWGKELGGAVKKWWEGISGSDAYRNAKTIGEKASVVWNSFADSIRNWWTNGGQAKVQGAVTTVSTFMWDNFLKPAISVGFDMAKTAVVGFAKEHPFFATVASLVLSGWVVRKGANFIMFLNDVLAFVNGFKPPMLPPGGGGGTPPPPGGTGTPIVSTMGGKTTPGANIGGKIVTYGTGGKIVTDVAKEYVKNNKVVDMAKLNKLNTPYTATTRFGRLMERLGNTKVVQGVSKFTNAVSKSPIGKTTKYLTEPIAKILKSPLVKGLGEYVPFLSSLPIISTAARRTYGISDAQTNGTVFKDGTLSFDNPVEYDKQIRAGKIKAPPWYKILTDPEAFWDYHLTKVAIPIADMIVKPSKKKKSAKLTSAAPNFNVDETYGILVGELMNHDRLQRPVIDAMMKQYGNNGKPSEQLNTKLGELVLAFDEKYKTQEGMAFDLAVKSVQGSPYSTPNFAPLQSALAVKLQQVGQQAVNLAAQIAQNFAVKYPSSPSVMNTPDFKTWGLTDSTKPPGKSGGEWRVPKDGIRLVHRDETILPRGEARAYRNGGSTGDVVIAGNTFHVREEADIDKIALALARQMYAN